MPTALPFIQNFETDYYSGINEQEEVLEDILEVSKKNNQSTVEDTSEIESFLIENTCPKSRGCRCVCDDFGNDWIILYVVALILKKCMPWNRC